MSYERRVIETLSSPTGLVVGLDEAKRHLDVWDPAYDVDVLRCLHAGVEYCENWGDMTLRLDATRTLSCDRWPASGFVLRRPPFKDVASIDYYPQSGVLTTWPTQNFRVFRTSASYGLVEFSKTAVLPTLEDRADALTVTYTCGYGTAEAVPSAVKQAVLMAARYAYGKDEVQDLNYTRVACQRLLAGTAGPIYA